MGANRKGGPAGMTEPAASEVEDGTLARVRSPSVGTTGLGATGSPRPRHRTVAKGNCSFLNPQSRGTVRAPRAAFDRLRRNTATASLSASRQKARQVWPDKSSSAALEFDIQIGNEKYTLIRPSSDDAKRHLPTNDQVLTALRAIPVRQRTCTDTITLSPNASPSSGAGATTAGDAGDGKVYLYPMQDAQEQEDFDNRLMHEFGHNYGQHIWGGPEGVQDWTRTAAADDVHPSPYSWSDGEDFPEFLILYNTAKGTPCEETAKAIYPHRWEKMESYQ